MPTLRQFTCAHLSQTDPDEKGKALCADCGCVLQVRLTPEVLADAMRSVLERGAEPRPRFR